MSTRRLHHHNLQQDNISNYDSDDLKDNKQQHQPRTVLGNYKPPNNKTSNIMKESHAVLDALSDNNSQLAKFLFVGSSNNNKEPQDNDNDDNHRRRKRRVSWFTTNYDDDTNIKEDMPSMGRECIMVCISIRTYAYS